MRTSMRAYRLLRVKLCAGVLAGAVIALAELILLSHHYSRCATAGRMELTDTRGAMGGINWTLLP